MGRTIMRPGDSWLEGHWQQKNVSSRKNRILWGERRVELSFVVCVVLVRLEFNCKSHSLHHLHRQAIVFLLNVSNSSPTKVAIILGCGIHDSSSSSLLHLFICGRWDLSIQGIQDCF
jgi:hypothetical protein